MREAAFFGYYGVIFWWVFLGGSVSRTDAFFFVVPSASTPSRTGDTIRAASSCSSGSRRRSTRRRTSILSTATTRLFSSPPAASTPATAATTTSAVAYPTARGSESDARKIVAAGSARQHLQAVLVSHCLFATRALAEESLQRLRTAQVDFETLAGTVSACRETREEKGAVGWINVVSHNEDHDNDADNDDTSSSNNNASSNNNSNEHLDAILPRSARETLVQMVTKPGDVVLLQSSRGYHLIQIVDIMANVSAMAVHRRKRRHAQNNSSQSLGLEDNLTYKIETMGCQMNLADSERIEGQLLSLGIRPYTESQNDKRAGPDVVVLNTCSIRDHAEQKVYSYMGPHVKRKREGDNSVTLIVAGCVAQQEGKALLTRAPEIDLVLGPQFANRLGDLLEDVRVHGNQVVATAATHIMEDATKPRRGSTVAAWVNVIYGCNERCTFCIVPTTRGVEQSRPVESIVREVTDLVQNQGYKEITLLGQNIDAYGRDMAPKRKFSDLIRTVGAVQGLERLRFVTSHPRYMSMGVVDAVAETNAACECFHIPFQSGSNEILAAMGRGHTREKYLRIVDRIRTVRTLTCCRASCQDSFEFASCHSHTSSPTALFHTLQRIPDAAITADVIVGFPGETEQNFQQTLDLMQEVVFDSVNTAAYSPRPNTPAAVWDNQIDDDVKQERLQRINALNLEHAARRRSRMMGRTVPVLVEERNVKVPTQVMGRTRHGYIVYCEGDIDELRGQTIQVKIDTTETYYLAGSMVEEKEEEQ